MADVTVTYSGTIIWFEPNSDGAREWTDENVEVPGWAWMGPRFACEPRLAEELVAGYEENGFSVEVCY